MPAATATDALRVERVDSFERTHYPLTLTILPATRIQLQWQWDSRRLAHAQMEQLQRHYLALLEQLADEGECAPRFVGELAVRRSGLPAEPLLASLPAWRACHERFAVELLRDNQLALGQVTDYV